MPPTILLQSAIFSTGLLLGVGTTAYLINKPQPVLPPAAVEVLPPKVNRGEAGAILDSAQGGFRKAVDGEIWKFGVPSATSDVLRRQAYITAYDRRLQHPAWTAEHLTIANLARAPAPAGGQSGISRDKSKFEEDDEIPSLFRAKLKDYFKSGYDRGHMVPAADAKISQQAMNETFLLSNIAPQIGEGFNRHYWAYFEEWCRKLTNEFSDVYVFTIPMYLPSKSMTDGKWRVTHEVIGNPPSISVPTHFSKVILTSRVPRGEDPLKSNKREVSMAGFVLPNSIIPDQASLESFQVPVEQIEKLSGLTLFAPEIKSVALELCRETKCQVVVRRFDDAKKKLEKAGGGQKLIGGGRN